MKKRKGIKMTIALLLAAILLFGAGGIMATQARLTIFSNNYTAQFAMDHLGITLLENGETVPEDGLLTTLSGAVEPGKTYREEIAARNSSDSKQFVRLILRKYWMNDGEKNTELDPGLIELSFDGKAYNNGSWQINNAETTTEMATYYYTKALAAGEDTVPLVNKLKVNGSVADPEHINVSDPVDGVITYEYEYDGYTIGIEADVQAIQTHNANDAIKSSWGVQNVKVSGSKLTVE